MSNIPSPLGYGNVRYIETDKSDYLAPLGALGFGALTHGLNGPVLDISKFADKDTQVSLYGEPVDANATEWWNIARAFQYRQGTVSPTAKVVRVVGDGSTNGVLAVTDTELVNATDLTTQRIDNADGALNATIVFDTSTLANGGDDSITKLKFFSKYPTAVAYEIALATVTDFPTALIKTGVSFSDNFPFSPDGTELAIAVLVDGDIKEKWIVDLTPGNVDGENLDTYIENVINQRSNYILCYENDSNTSEPVSFEATALTKGSVVQPVKADYIEGLALFDDIDSVDINYMVGHNLVIDEMVTLMENRLDSQMYWGATTSLVVGVNATTAINNLVEYTTTTFNRNTTYASFYGNAILFYDEYAKKYRWGELSGDIVGLRILKNLTGNEWEANAGLNYGQLRGVTRFAFNPKSTLLAELQKNKINPCIAKSGKGNVVWGIQNYTNKKSSLIDTTTRGLTIHIWRASREFLEYKLFEINDDITRNQIKSKIDQFMNNVQANRGVYSYLTICDETNNTAQVIDQGQLVVTLRIKPSRIAKEIVLNLALYGSGADLSIG